MRWCGKLEKNARLSAGLVWTLDAADHGRSLDHAKEEKSTDLTVTAIRIVDPWEDGRRGRNWLSNSLIWLLVPTWGFGKCCLAMLHLTYWWGISMCPPGFNDLSLTENRVTIMKSKAMQEIAGEVVLQPTVQEILEFREETRWSQCRNQHLILLLSDTTVSSRT